MPLQCPDAGCVLRVEGKVELDINLTESLWECARIVRRRRLQGIRLRSRGGKS